MFLTNNHIINGFCIFIYYIFIKYRIFMKFLKYGKQTYSD